MSRSSLTRYAPLMRDADPDAPLQMAKKAWHESGIVILFPDQIEKTQGWAAGQEARNLAARCYGKRSK
jgi:hypothetical protein